MRMSAIEGELDKAETVSRRQMTRDDITGKTECRRIGDSLRRHLLT